MVPGVGSKCNASYSKTMYPIKIETVSALISSIDLISTDSQPVIYRGESQVYSEPCTPSLFRHTEHDPISGIFGEYRNERSRVEQWRKQVEGAEGSYLNYQNDLDLMILGRHYDLLTRLLDWSSNPLVSLWFAASGNDDKDGSIYTVDEPLGIDSKNDFAKPRVSSDRWNALEKNPFCLTMPSHLVGEYNEAKPFKDIHFFRPNSLPNPRILSQSGIISIHPNPSSENTGKFKPLRKFEIPAESKSTLRQELKVLGIDNRSLGLATRDGIANKLNKSINN